MSALLTTTILRMPEIIGGLETAALRHQVKVLVGGVAVSQRYADEIGAEGSGANAASAVEQAMRLVSAKARP